jgi:hypothetical protein
MHDIMYSRVTLRSRTFPTLHPLLVCPCQLEHLTQPLSLFCVSESLRKEVLQIVPELYRVQCTWSAGSCSRRSCSRGRTLSLSLLAARCRSLLVYFHLVSCWRHWYFRHRRSWVCLLHCRRRSAGCACTRRCSTAAQHHHAEFHIACHAKFLECLEIRGGLLVQQDLDLLVR